MLDPVVLAHPDCRVTATDGCVVLERGEHSDSDDRLVFTRGQAALLASMISPFSLVLSVALQRASERAVSASSDYDASEDE